MFEIEKLTVNSSNEELLAGIALRLLEKKFPRNALLSLINPPKVESVIPIWLQSKKDIEIYLSKRWVVEKVEIISGLDDPMIPSPEYLYASPLKVTKWYEFTDSISVEEKCKRARNMGGTILGIRDAIMCTELWRKIPKTLVHPMYFLNALVVIDGLLHIARLSGKEYLHNLRYDRVGGPSSFHWFARTNN